jgi:hypothetical protein
VIGAKQAKLIGSLVLVAAASFLTVTGFARTRARSVSGGTGAAVDLPAAVRTLPRSLVSTSVNERGGYVDLKLGPINLPAGIEGLRTPIQLVSMPVTGWIRGFEWSLEDDKGNALPNSLLHHVNLIDPARRELFGPAPLRVMAAGNETRSLNLPVVLGYPLEPNTQFMVVAMFANPTAQGHGRAFLRVRIRYSDAKWTPRLNIFPFYLDAMGLVGEKSFDVPPGQTRRSWEARPAADVRILGLSGHAHDYVRALELTDVTTGARLYSARLALDDKGKLLGVPLQYVFWQGGIKLQKDHRYRITVEYDNPTSKTHGGMGVIAGLALGRKAWPNVNPSDPEYLADIHNIIAAPMVASGKGGHHH